MPILNLTAENDCQQAIKDYLVANVSDILANKINNGVKIEKDGKTLINKKTLAGFWEYASKKAQEQKTGYVKNETVFGWAIHYFEESDIIGTLYNEDGTKYTPPKPEYKPTQHVPAPTIPQKPAKPQHTQASLFDILTVASTKEQQEDKIKETVEEPVEGTIEEIDTSLTDDNELPTEFDVDENGEIIKPVPIKETKPNSIYSKYLDIEKQYPHAVVAYRLGDFYEICGDIAVIVSRELELTLTGRDCGLSERVPMIGFPYYAPDAYFKRIRQRRKLVVVDNDEIQVLDKLGFEEEAPKPIPSENPKEAIIKPIDYNDDLEELRTQSNHIDKDALCILLELFDYELDVQ